MSDLHVYKNEVIEWVVATSPEDAAEVIRPYYRDTGTADEEGDFEFTQEPDDKVMQMRADAPEDNPPRTCREWVELNGRGFLASTEW